MTTLRMAPIIFAPLPSPRRSRPSPLYLSSRYCCAPRLSYRTSPQNRLPASHAGSRSAERRRTPHTGREAVLARPEPRQGEMGGRSGSCLRFAATRYLWCGCGAADEVGLDNSDGHWNLAANYFELPRAEPGFNMVAVRYGHVAVLKSHVSGSIWIAFDPNSGGHRAHTHEIDLRHFRAVVDPHGSPVKHLAAYRHRHHRIRYARR